MKQPFFILPVLIFLLSISCSSADSSTEEPGSEPLRFSAGNANWTKTYGADYTGNLGANPIPDMLIYGYYTDDNAWLSTTRDPAFPLFLDAIIVTNSGGIWSYTPPSYFFPTGYHSFFAFAPYQSVIEDNRNSIFIFTGEETPTLSYYLPDEVAEHKDLLIGWETDLGNQSEPVQITFRHIMTKITFKACLADDNTVPSNTEVKILSITFSEIYSHAEANILYTQESEEIRWQKHSELRDMYVSTTDHSLTDIALTKTMTSITPAERALYSIPQEITARAQGGATPAIILAIEEYNTDNGNRETYIQTLDLSLLGTIWTPGQTIDFQITYKGSDSPIVFRLVDPGSNDSDELLPIE